METNQFLQRLSTTPPPVSDGDIKKLEQFVDHYPWCGIAHQLLLEAIYLSGNEHIQPHLAKAAIYVVSRSRLHQRMQEIKVQQSPASTDSIPEENYITLDLGEPEEKNETIRQPAVKIMPVVPAHTTAPMPAVPGSEYFSAADLSNVEPGDDAVGRFIAEKPKIKPLSSSLLGVEALPTPKFKSYALEDMVTETLAKIYADQGLYTLAIGTYEKLSLLEPKKSAYFAALIRTLKSKSKF
jgi:hypothetical protein